jgi:hypothetical protein
MPAASPLPTQIAPPIALSPRNRGQAMRMAPASGGAMMAKPGTNLAIIRELTPQRSKRDWVWLTQESGSREMRHSVFSTRIP